MPHPFGDDVELRRTILTYLGEQTLPRIVRLSAPLFVADDRGTPVQVATAILLQIGSSRLLVTATHVTVDWPGLAINVGDEFVHVRGKLVTAHSVAVNPGSREDKLDLAVVRLDDSLAQRIDDDHVTTLGDLDLTAPVIGRDPFVLAGYPAKRNSNGLSGDEFTARAYSLLLHDADLSTYAAASIDPSTQLMLPFEKRDTWTIEKQVSAPDLKGISGGGLWRVPINDEAVRETRLAAIAVEQHPKGVHRHMRATRVSVLLSLVYNLHPDLRAPIANAFDQVV
jgi:hypothetical protein